MVSIPRWGVPRKPLDVLLRMVRAKIVQHEKGVEKRGFPAAEHPPQGHACAIDHLLAVIDMPDLSSHGFLLSLAAFASISRFSPTVTPRAGLALRTKTRYICSVIAHSPGRHRCNPEDIEIHMAKDSQKIQRKRSGIRIFHGRS